MIVRKRLAGVVLGFMLLASGFALGQLGQHPNLEAAAHDCEQAIQHITAAQKANEFDFEGHGQRAKVLLNQAVQEIKLSAAAASRNRR